MDLNMFYRGTGFGMWVRNLRNLSFSANYSAEASSFLVMGPHVYFLCLISAGAIVEAFQHIEHKGLEM